MTDVLVYLPFPIHPVNQANRARLRWLCDDLKAMGVKLHGLLHMREDGGRVPEPMLRAHSRYFETFHMVPQSVPVPPPSGPHHRLEDLADPALAAYLPALLAGRGFDAVLVGGLAFAPVLDLVPPGMLKVLDAQDRPSLRRPAPDRPDLILLDAATERDCLTRADLVLATRGEDAAAFRRAVPGLAVLTLGIRPPALVRVARRPRQPILRCTYLGLRSAAARRAVQMLAEAVAARPALRGRVEIEVAGSAAEFLTPALLARAGPVLKPGVAADDLAALYGRTDAFLIPVAAGGSFRIQTIEALGTGLPVLATLEGMDGIGSAHPAQACADVGALLDAALAFAEGRDDLDAVARAGEAVLDGYRTRHGAALSELVRGLSRPRLVLDPGEAGMAEAVWLVSAAALFGRMFDLGWIGPPEALSDPLAMAVALRAGQLQAVEAPGRDDLVWTADPAIARRAAAVICPAPKSLDALRRAARVARGTRPVRFLIRSLEQKRLLEDLVPDAVADLLHPVETAEPVAAAGVPVLLLLDGLEPEAALRWFARFDAALAGRGADPDLTLVHGTPDVFSAGEGVRIIDPRAALLSARPGPVMLVDPGRPGSEEWDFRAWAYSQPGAGLALDSRMKAHFAHALGTGARPARITTPEEAAALVVRHVYAAERPAIPPVPVGAGLMRTLHAARCALLPGRNAAPEEGGQDAAAPAAPVSLPPREAAGAQAP